MLLFLIERSSFITQYEALICPYLFRAPSAAVSFSLTSAMDPYLPDVHPIAQQIHHLYTTYQTGVNDKSYTPPRRAYNYATSSSIVLRCCSHSPIYQISPCTTYHMCLPWYLFASLNVFITESEGDGLCVGVVRRP